MTKQTIIRVTALARTLDTIQAALEAGMTPEQKKGAKWALDAVRREYGIPAEGDQLEMDLKPKKKRGRG